MANTILTELKYKTFTSLLEDVRGDLKGFALTGRIDPQSLIKIAKRVSYDLGLRINMTKETIIEIDHGKGRLPDDFYVMNIALVCGEFTVNQVLPQGTTVTDIVPAYRTYPQEALTCTDPVLSSCNPTKLTQASIGNTPLCLTRCGDGFQLIQTVNSQTRTYKYMLPIKFRQSKEIQCDCPNLNWMCPNEAYIKGGFVYMASANTQSSLVSKASADFLECGKLYISYEGNLEDANGDLLVLDHDEINNYYEYALKERILENLYLEGEQTVINMLQLVQAKLREARNRALSIVNTPNFSEMMDTWTLNRKAAYLKYYQIFSTYPYPYNYSNG